MTETYGQFLRDTQSDIYTNSDLTISILAKEMNKNFFDLINEKRVEKAKELLCNKINTLTIEVIAYEAGFNNRASF